MFFLSCVCYAFVRVCLYVTCGHLLGRTDSWLSFVVSNCEIGTLSQVWYLIVLIPDLCNLTYFVEDMVSFPLLELNVM